jgi:hypothetical protein
MKHKVATPGVMAGAAGGGVLGGALSGGLGWPIAVVGVAALITLAWTIASNDRRMWLSSFTFELVDARRSKADQANRQYSDPASARSHHGPDRERPPLDHDPQANVGRPRRVGPRARSGKVVRLGVDGRPHAYAGRSRLMRVPADG